MKIQSIALSAILLSGTGFFSTSHALPTEESLQGIMTLCAGGRSTEVQGSLKASISKWLTQASAEGKGSLDDMGAIIKQTKDDKIRVEALSVYQNCAMGMIKLFLESDAKEKAEIAKKEAADESRKSKTSTATIEGGENNSIKDSASVTGDSGQAEAKIKDSNSSKITGSGNVGDSGQAAAKITGGSGNSIENSGNSN